jgi:fucose permease
MKNSSISRRNTVVFLILISYAQFIVLGMPGGYFGAAWPSMQTEFGLPLDGVGIYLLLNTIGYTLASFFNAQISARTGFGKGLLLGAALYAVGFAGIAFAPFWGWVVLFGLMTGFGGGIIDASLNRYLAARSNTMLLNWLHACYGIGATLGPAGLSILLSFGQSWRTGFWVMTGLQVVVAAAVLLSLNRWESSQAGTATSEIIQPAESASVLETLAVPAVWLGMLLFFVYTGVEMTAGQWTYSLFTIARHIPETTAGWWASLYWASFTIGRIFLGVLIDRFGFARSMRAMLGGAFLGALLLWWNPVDGVSFAGLAILGFALAPVFPTLIAVTPKVLGNRLAANAIGMQMAFGGLGIAAFPWLAGFLAQRTTLEIIGPFIIVSLMLAMALFELLLRRKAETQGQARPEAIKIPNP